MNAPPQLPAHDALNVGAFLDLFQVNDTSYKFLWMLAILDSVFEQREIETMQASRLVKKMLETAHPLILNRHFSFGKKDRIRRHLGQGRRYESEALMQATRHLVEFAPFRLLVPFLPKGSLTRLPKKDKNPKIRKYAMDSFEGKNPTIYRLRGGHGALRIEIHPLWRKYLLENYTIIRQWVLWKFEKFLEPHNPGRVDIMSHLELGHRQPSTDPQRRFWQDVIGGIRPYAPGAICIYSGKALTSDDFNLSHYVPHHFIGRSNAWNLLPADPAASASKSDSLPHARYFDDFVTAQHGALTACRELPQTSLTEQVIEEYAAALKVERGRLFSSRGLRTAYKRLMDPFMKTAEECKFPRDWEYLR